MPGKDDDKASGRPASKRVGDSGDDMKILVKTPGAEEWKQYPNDVAEKIFKAHAAGRPNVEILLEEDIHRHGFSLAHYIIDLKTMEAYRPPDGVRKTIRVVTRREQEKMKEHVTLIDGRLGSRMTMDPLLQSAQTVFDKHHLKPQKTIVRDKDESKEKRRLSEVSLKSRDSNKDEKTSADRATKASNRSPPPSPARPPSKKTFGAPPSEAGKSRKTDVSTKGHRAGSTEMPAKVPKRPSQRTSQRTSRRSSISGVGGNRRPTSGSTSDAATVFSDEEQADRTDTLILRAESQMPTSETLNLGTQQPGGAERRSRATSRPLTARTSSATWASAVAEKTPLRDRLVRSRVSLSSSQAPRRSWTPRRKSKPGRSGNHNKMVGDMRARLKRLLYNVWWHQSCHPENRALRPGCNFEARIQEVLNDFEEKKYTREQLEDLTPARQVQYLEDQFRQMLWNDIDVRGLELGYMKGMWKLGEKKSRFHDERWELLRQLNLRKRQARTGQFLHFPVLRKTLKIVKFQRKIGKARAKAMRDVREFLASYPNYGLQNCCWGGGLRGGCGGGYSPSFIPVQFPMQTPHPGYGTDGYPHSGQSLEHDIRHAAGYPDHDYDDSYESYGHGNDSEYDDGYDSNGYGGYSDYGDGYDSYSYGGYSGYGDGYDSYSYGDYSGDDDGYDSYSYGDYDDSYDSYGYGYDSYSRSSS